MLKLHAGVSKKVGLPGFSSASASCTIEAELDSGLLNDTGIHTAVEQHYQAQLSGDPKPDLDALPFAYRSAWLRHDPDAIQLGSKETRESLDDLAARMLTAFLNSPAASVQGRVVTDIKTSRGKWSQEQVEDSGKQLLL